MIGERLARFSLRADALYCIGLGALLANQRKHLADLTNYPPDVLAAAGTGTVLWGLAVARMAGSENWTAPTRAVALANVTAVGALTWFGANRGGSARRFVMGIAGQVGAFALSQWAALAATKD